MGIQHKQLTIQNQNFYAIYEKHGDQEVVQLLEQIFPPLSHLKVIYLLDEYQSGFYQAQAFFYSTSCNHLSRQHTVFSMIYLFHSMVIYILNQIFVLEYFPNHLIQ